MKSTRKPVTMMAVVLLLGTATFTSCDVMLDVLGGMAIGMSSYSPYGYAPNYRSTNYNHYLDPNYAMMQAQQQQTQMNAVQNQLINQSMQQAEKDMERINKTSQQLIDLSIEQAIQGINLGGTDGTMEAEKERETPAPPTPTIEPKQHQCGVCGGSGREIRTDGTSFGKTKYCSECGKTVPDSHYHAPCRSCKGKGEW